MEMMKKVFYLLSGAVTALTLIAALVFPDKIVLDIVSLGYLWLCVTLLAFFLVLTFAPKGGRRGEGGFKYSKKNGDGKLVYVKDETERPANERDRKIGSVVLFAGSLFLPFIFFFDSVRGWTFVGILIAALIAGVIFGFVMAFIKIQRLKKELAEHAAQDEKLRREQAEKEAMGRWK